MNKLILAAVLGATACSAERPEAKQTEQLWKEFKAINGKVYESVEEEAHRMAIFMENVARAAALTTGDNAVEGGSATYSATHSPFGDMSEEEFSKLYLGGLAVTPKDLKEHEEQAQLKKDGSGKKEFKIIRADDLPDEYDWTEKGAVTPVQNQGQCGSCWAFATVASIEGANFVSGHKLEKLSEQQVVDCSPADHGCQGGLPSLAYKDLLSQKMGLEDESAYSYTMSQNPSCQAKTPEEKVFLSGWSPISTNEDQIAAALMQYGPLAIGLNAQWMQMYHGGISDPWFCNPSGIDHGVTLVGFGHGQGGIVHKTDMKFWKIKNSWGPGWGEKGYYRLVRGKGKCGMNKMVTAAEVAKGSSTKFLGGNAEIYV